MKTYDILKKRHVTSAMKLIRIYDKDVLGLFFICGISQGEKKLDFVQTLICSQCGQFGRLEVFMTYMYFSLFFIPVFRWGVKYYVKSSCCGTVYEIDRTLGKRLKGGENITLTQADLHMSSQGYRHTQTNECPYCGYQIDSDFEFCPKCGKKL